MFPFVNGGITSPVSQEKNTVKHYHIKYGLGFISLDGQIRASLEIISTVNIGP